MPLSDKSVKRLGQRQRVGALEAGIQQRIAAAIGEGPAAVAAPHHQGFAPGAQQRIAFAHRGLGARARASEGAAQALGGALFRQGPKRSGDGQRHRARRQGGQHDQAAIVEAGFGTDGKIGGKMAGEGGKGQEQGEGRQAGEAPPDASNP